jgi:hypothetical protein
MSSLLLLLLLLLLMLLKSKLLGHDCLGLRMLSRTQSPSEML